jgi:hypothetical protein
MKKILVSYGFGAGWSTWADAEVREFVLTYPPLVEAVENEDYEEAIRIANLMAHQAEKEDHYIYIGTGGRNIRQLEVVEVDSPFRIDEYDGRESVIYLNIDSYIDPKDLP